MKRILEITIFLFAFACNAQNVTMRGVYTFYQTEDSSANFSMPHSKTIYNSDFEKIYEEFYTELGDSTSNLFFEDFRKSPELTVKGFISEKDTSKYFYTENCDTGEKYIIQDGDTTDRYTIECLNYEIIKIVCTKGLLTSDTLIKLNNNEYWKTTLPDGTIEYTLRKFDSKGRVTLYRSNLSSMSDTTGNFTRYEYDDEKYIETTTSSSVGVEDKFGTTVINYCDDKWIPIKREVIELHDGAKTMRRFEYIRID